MPSCKPHNRRFIRLRDYDYSSFGEYFITICTQNRECLFGEVVDGEMILNDLGKIAQKDWLQTEITRENVEMDIYVISQTICMQYLELQRISMNQANQR